MELKLRRLYLYAANTQVITKNPQQTVDQFSLKKQLEINHLKDLLNSKIQLPPISSLLLEAKKSREISQAVLERKMKGQINNQVQTKRQPNTQQNNNKNNRSQSIRGKYYYDNRARITSKAKVNSKFLESEQGEKEAEQKYEKFINEYIERIKRENLLEDQQADYGQLVHQACEEIKRKVEQQGKNKIRTERRQKKQEEVGKRQKNKNRSSKSYSKFQEQSYYTELLSENPTNEIKNQRLHHKNNGSLSKISKYKKSKGKLECNKQSDSNSKLSIKFSERSSNKDLRKLYEQGLSQKAQLNANKVMYELNLQNLKKRNDFIEKQRKLSARTFARSLYKHSFHYKDK